MKKVIGILAVLFILSGVVYAQSETVIHACVNSKGSLKIVQDENSCKGGETYITWNSQGPQGEQGPPGPEGPAGPPGADGQDATCGGSANYSLVGFSTQTSEATGTLAMSTICNNEFTNSRICMLSEVIRSYPVSGLPNVEAWIINDGLFTETCYHGNGYMMDKDGVIRQIANCPLLKAVACCAP